MVNTMGIVVGRRLGSHDNYHRFLRLAGSCLLNWPDSTLTSERCHRLLHQAGDYGAFNFQPFPLPAHLNANRCGSAV
jgi:hypothetical protein